MPTPAKKAKPKGWVMHHDAKGTLWTYPNTEKSTMPVAVIPCASAKQARKVLAMHKDQSVRNVLEYAASALEAIPVNPSSNYWQYRHNKVRQIRFFISNNLPTP